jgi:hypothetical protein
LLLMLLGVGVTAAILIVNIFHHLYSLAITSYPLGIALAGLVLYAISSERGNTPN